MESIQTTIEKDFVEEFAERITPEIYRNNAFRILQLPPQATVKEIQKRHQIITISERTGVDVPLGSFPILALTNPIPNSLQINEAIQRINDPQTRLLDELFWFWPDGDKLGPDYQCNDSQGITKLIDQLTKNEENDPDNPIPIHNLAVLYHASALDIELSMVKEDNQDKDLSRLQSFWTLTYKYWSRLTQIDEFWDEVTRRIRQYDDPRLTTGSSRKIRAQLPRLITRIHAQLVIWCYEKSKYEEGSRTLHLLRLADFPNELIEESLKWAVGPIRQRIKSYIAQIKEFQDLELPYANKTIQSMIDQGIFQLGILDRCLSSTDLTRNNAHDEFALAVLSSIQDYFQRTEQCSEALNLLSRLETIAYSPSTKEEIAKASKFVQEFQKDGNFWYSATYYDQPPNVIHSLGTARKLVKQGQIEQAIQAIEADLNNRASITSDDKDVYAYPLSYCYNQKGVKALNSNNDLLDQPRTLIQKIINGVQSQNPASLMTIRALASNNIDYYGRMGMVTCMGCGRRIEQQYVVITYNNLKMLICPNCNQRDQTERSQRLQVITTNLSQAVRDLLYAQELNPNNCTAANNLKVARDIASNLNISIPNNSCRPNLKTGKIQQSAPSPGMPDANFSTPRSADVDHGGPNIQRSENKGIIWAFLTIMVVIILFIFFSVIGNPGTYTPPNSNSTNNQSPIENQKLTAAPVILPSATYRLPTITPIPTAVALRGCFTTNTNVRSGPGTNYSILGYFQPGDCNPVVGISLDRGWYQMRAKGPSNDNVVTIWVYAKNVSLDINNGSVSNLPVVP